MNLREEFEPTLISSHGLRLLQRVHQYLASNEPEWGHGTPKGQDRTP